MRLKRAVYIEYHLLSLFVQIKINQAPALQPVQYAHFQYAHPINYTVSEINGRCFFKVFSRAGNFSYRKAVVNNLRKHLVVKNKIVGIGRIIYGFEHMPGISTVARVVF